MIALSAVCRGPARAVGAEHARGASRRLRAHGDHSGPRRADPRAFGVRAERVLRGDAASLSVDMGAGRAAGDLAARRRRTGRGGRSARSASRTRSRGCRSTGIRSCSRPRCGATSARATSSLDLDGAVGYAEKNWGHGFPGRWWWGHAATFGDDDVSVSFAGGRVALRRRRGRADGGRRPAGPPGDRAGAAAGHDARRAGRRHAGGCARAVAATTSRSTATPAGLGARAARPRPGPRCGASCARASISRAACRCACGAARRLLYDGRSALAGLEVELPLSRSRRGAPRA